MSKKFLIPTLISLFSTLIAFVTILIVLSLNDFAPLNIDETIRNWAYNIRGDKNGATFWFFRVITELGYLYFVIFIIILMGIIWKFRSKTWFFSGTILFSWIIQKIVKICVNRPRPDADMWWMTESSSSFPSGHSITVACVFILLAYFIISSPKVQIWFKYAFATLSAVSIFLVPLSRIILGVHYFTDVLAGVFLGAFIAILGILFYKIFITNTTKKHQQTNDIQNKKNTIITKNANKV